MERIPETVNKAMRQAKLFLKIFLENIVFSSFRDPGAQIRLTYTNDHSGN